MKKALFQSLSRVAQTLILIAAYRDLDRFGNWYFLAMVLLATDIGIKHAMLEDN